LFYAAVGSGQMLLHDASARETNDPAIHEFPAALQVGLVWSKAMGENPDRKSLYTFIFFTPFMFIILHYNYF